MRSRVGAFLYAMVTPAKAEGQGNRLDRQPWMPAFAGMTVYVDFTERA